MAILPSKLFSKASSMATPLSFILSNYIILFYYNTLILIQTRLRKFIVGTLGDCIAFTYANISQIKWSKTLAFLTSYYEVEWDAIQSVELFCTYSQWDTVDSHTGFGISLYIKSGRSFDLPDNIFVGFCP